MLYNSVWLTLMPELILCWYAHVLWVSWKQKWPLPIQHMGWYSWTLHCSWFWHLTRMGPSSRLRTFLYNHYIEWMWWRWYWCQWGEGVCIWQTQGPDFPVDHLVIPCSMLDRIKLCKSACAFAHIMHECPCGCSFIWNMLNSTHIWSYSQENQYNISSELTVWQYT